MPTKTTSKGGSGKKSSTAGKSASKKPAATKKAAAAAPPPPADDDLDDAPTPAPVAAAPAKAPARSRYGKVEQEAPPIVPARRLTPEAKARVNEMVAKGIPLGEALRAAAAWETFVAPVREEPPKLVQGQAGDGPKPPRDAEHEEEAEEADEEEPVAADSDE